MSANYKTITEYQLLIDGELHHTYEELYQATLAVERLCGRLNAPIPVDVDVEYEITGRRVEIRRIESILPSPPSKFMPWVESVEAALKRVETSIDEIRSLPSYPEMSYSEIRELDPRLRRSLWEHTRTLYERCDTIYEEASAVLAQLSEDVEHWISSKDC